MQQDNPTSPIRCFIAIEIPRGVRNRLLEIQEMLRGQIRHASWVKPGNIHLTLRFLGDIDPKAVETVGAAMKQVASVHRSFLIQFGGIEAFPNLSRPRAVWVGVTVGKSQAAAIAEDINDALRRCGFPPDNKKFNAHLTLARVKERVNLRPFAELYRQYAGADDAATEAREISLIQSRLHPSGAIYTTLRSYALAPDRTEKPGDQEKTD